MASDDRVRCGEPGNGWVVIAMTDGPVPSVDKDERLRSWKLPNDGRVAVSALVDAMSPKPVAGGTLAEEVVVEPKRRCAPRITMSRNVEMWEATGSKCVASNGSFELLALMLRSEAEMGKGVRPHTSESRNVAACKGLGTVILIEPVGAMMRRVKARIHQRAKVRQTRGG